MEKKEERKPFCNSPWLTPAPPLPSSSPPPPADEPCPLAENAELALTLPFLIDLDLVVHWPDMTGARAAEGPEAEERASDGRPRSLGLFW